MKVLITGGAGFIGSHLAHSLVKRGDKVTIVDDLSMGRISNIADIPQVSFYKRDVRDYDFMHGILKKGNFDYIYFLAAIASVADSIERPWKTHQVNSEAIINSLDFIRQEHIEVKRILFSSSAAVYGDGEEIPKREESDIRPLSPYAIDKFSAERYMIDYGNLYHLPTVCVRFFNVYGPRQNPKSPYSGVLSIITDCLKKNKTFNLYGNGSQTRDFIFVEDVVRAIITIVEKSAKSTVFNIANGVENSLVDVIQEYEKVTHRELNIEYYGTRDGDIKKSVADISRLRKLGFKSQWSLGEGLSEYWNSVRSE